jgi:hypothetical protein
MNESSSLGAETAPDPRKPEPGGQFLARAEQCLFEPPADAVLVLPESCVNCGEPSGASFRLEPPLGRPWRSVLAPHCARCARRFERYKTRQAVALGSAVLAGLVMLLGLPLVGGRATLFTYCLLVTGAAVVPLVIASFATRRAVREAGQTAPEVAIWWDKRGLNGTNGEWFSALANQNQGERRSGKSLRLPPWPHVFVPATLVAVSPTVYQWLYPTLVVLNLSPSQFDLAVDGVVRASIGVTSLESVNAGVRVPVSAGPHVIEARPEVTEASAADELFRVEVDLEAGGEYLYAPGADGYCFWLERTAYGAQASKSRVQPLGGKNGFFRLPAAVDTWFASNPEPNSDNISTGGEMVAVRHGRCSDKPGASGAARD